MAVCDSLSHRGGPAPPCQTTSQTKMAAYLRRVHHIAIHVSNVDKIAHELVSKFKFNLFAARLTDESRQLAFRKGGAVFVVNERSTTTTRRTGDDERLNENIINSDTLTATTATHRHHHGTSTSTRQQQTETTCHSNNNDYMKCHYDVTPRYPVDTACNVCFEVEDVERSFNALRNHGCDFLVPPTVVQDDKGLVTYSVLKSIVGNVCHTLLDRSRYNGEFLPGFDDVIDNHTNNESSSLGEGDGSSCCPITHFDHITYACPKETTAQVMRWYEKLFGFKRFYIDRDEDVDEGYVLKGDGIGLRLTAMEYWKCSEVGIALPFMDKKEPDCKFVMAESLPEQGRNQVDTFLEEHGGPGIQHIGLYTDNIVSTAQTMANGGVHFFSPPPTYYTEVGKQQEMEDAGYSPQMLAQHGILLDTDLRPHGSSTEGTNNTSGENRRYLLQVFTKPIFAEDTFFLELIERRGATGFGEGNIRALWRSVQAYMESETGLSQGETTAENKLKTAQH